MSFKQSFSQTIALIKSDMQFRCDYENKKLTLIRALGFLLNHAMMSQILYRFQLFFYTHHFPWIATFIAALSSIIFTVKIDSRTQIGAGFLILHANYIHIGPYVKIGSNCILAQQNTIVPAFTLDVLEGVSDQGPSIGDHVLLGVGCVVVGNISVGSYSKVSVNTAVDKSFPEHSILVGVPAKNFLLAASKTV